MCAILIIFLFPVESLGEFEVTTARGLQKSPAIYGDVVVWQDNRPGSSMGDWDIYRYNLSTKEEFKIGT
jgi:beta propeller repeat protein